MYSIQHKDRLFLTNMPIWIQSWHDCFVLGTWGQNDEFVFEVAARVDLFRV